MSEPLHVAVRPSAVSCRNRWFLQPNTCRLTGPSV